MASPEIVLKKMTDTTSKYSPGSAKKDSYCKCLPGCETVGALTHWHRVCELYKSFGKPTLSTEAKCMGDIAHDPSFLLLSIWPVYIYKYMHQETGSGIFSTVPFTLENNSHVHHQKKGKWTAVDSYMEYYSTVNIMATMYNSMVEIMHLYLGKEVRHKKMCSVNFHFIKCVNRQKSV